MTHQIGHFIAGEFCGEPAVARANPAESGDVVARRPEGEAGTAADAVAAAMSAQEAWGRLPGPARGPVLADATDLLRQEPVVVTHVKPGHRIAQEEVFGPVVAVLTASDLGEAMQVASAVPYGLAADIVTGDLRAAHRFADTVQAGVVKVNRPTPGLDLNVPFGGAKDSSTSTFREQGSTAVNIYTRIKSVHLGVD